MAAGGQFMLAKRLLYAYYLLCAVARDFVPVKFAQEEFYAIE